MPLNKETKPNQTTIFCNFLDDFIIPYSQKYLSKELPDAFFTIF